MRISIRLALGIFSGFFVCAAVPAADAAYPSQPISLFCTHGAGGDTDFNTRLIARYLADELGQTIIVKNEPGANGSISLNKRRNSEPDGYTLVSTNTVAMSSNRASGVSDFGYEAFEPVAVFAKQSGENILIKADSPYRDLGELLSGSKQTQTGIRFGIALGGSSYLAAMKLMYENDANFELIDAGGDAYGRMQSLLDGYIDATIAPYTLAREHIEAGRIRALATLMSERLPAAPQIPTVKECGVEGLAIDTMFGIFAPKGTPAEIIDRLNQAVLRIVYENPRYAEEVANYNYQTPYALGVKETLEALRAQQEYFLNL